MSKSVALFDGLSVAASRTPVLFFHKFAHLTFSSVLSSLESMPASSRNQRDLFPMYIGPDAVSFSSTASSVSQLKRARHRRGLGGLIDEASSGLNAFAESKAGRPRVISERPPPLFSLPSRPHQLVRAYLGRSIRSYGRPPQDLSPPGALQELLRSKDTYDLDSSTTVKPCNCPKVNFFAKVQKMLSRATCCPCVALSLRDTFVTLIDISFVVMTSSLTRCT